MVAHLVRLKLTLLLNGLRRSVWQQVGLAFAALYALGLLALGVVGLVALSTQDVALRAGVVPAFGALLVLGWWVVPLVAFGVDATLDPTRFATYPVPRRSLLVGLALSGVVGVPGVATAVLCLATVVVWWHEPVAALVAVPCMVLALATAVVGSRATTSLGAAVLGRRRVREVLVVVMVLPLMLLGPILTGLTGVVTRLGSGGVDRLGEVAGWTPFGAAWAVPALVAQGQWGGAALRLLIALVTLGVLVAVWDRALTRAAVEPTGGGESAHAEGLGWFGRLPGTPTGAIAARCLTYWRRDPRYSMAVITLPLLLVVFLVAMPGGGMVVAVGPLAGMIFGWTVSADLAYDGSAFWMHLSAPIPAAADRWGRIVSTLVVGVPGSVVLTVAAAALAHRLDALPALLGMTLGLLLVALGCASVVSALVVYKARQPGENPFSTPQGASMAAMTSQLAGFTGVGLLASPVLVLGVVAMVRGSWVLGLLTLVLGLGIGVAVLLLGARIGARTLERRAPALFAQLASF